MPDAIQLMGDKQWQEIKSRLTGKFNKMMKGLFRQKGAQLDINILASDEAQEFITTHAGVLDAGFQKVEMSDKMRERLTRSNYIFSGIKTFHELNEAFPSMLDENGNKKPFERFLNDVQKINDTYNANYLHAEYNFVQASATMAAKWEQFSEDGDRYYLQYRTAKDDKVRPEHAALDGVTLPMSDSFWETYYPPNGWNCRCSVVQVRKQKYPATEHGEAMSRGEEAMNGERYNIFRFNSGKQGKTMPDYNPYTIRRCNDCDVAKGKGLTLAFVPDNQVCASCQLLQHCANDRTKSQSAIERTHYMQKEMKHLLGKKIEKRIDNKNISIKFDMRCIKHLFSDVKSRTRRLQLDDLKNIHQVLERSEYTNNAPPTPGHNNGFVHFYYFKARMSNGECIRFNIGKKIVERKNGKMIAEYYCYSINNI